MPKLVSIHKSHTRAGRRRTFTFAMQRSGQHLVIDWICRGLDSVAHFNHCRLYAGWKGLSLEPMTGRISIYANGEVTDSGPVGRKSARAYTQPSHLEHELYSLEDVLPSDAGYSRLAAQRTEPVVIIVRDPANWIASTLQHPKMARRAEKKVKAYVRMLIWIAEHEPTGDCVVIRFDRFVTSREYRDGLAAALGLGARDHAESALDRVPEFGGGSSFDGTGAQASNLSVLDRWQRFATDQRFIKLLRTPRLRPLAAKVFGTDQLAFLDTAAR
jgi:hypothetical protein